VASVKCPACGAETGGASTCPDCGINLAVEGPPGALPEGLLARSPGLLEADAPPDPGTTAYALRLAWVSVGVALVLPAVALLAWMFAAIAIWRGESGNGLAAIIAAAVTGAIGSVIWTLVLG
jgi:hypothetical protein